MNARNELFERKPTAPSALELSKAVNGRLAEPFAAKVGCYLTLGDCSVSVTPKPDRTGTLADGMVRLQCRLKPLLMPPPADREQLEADRAAMHECLATLSTGDCYAQAAACQMLGQLGMPEAEPALRRVLAESQEAGVRKTAEAALQVLGEPRADQSVFAEQHLVMEVAWHADPTGRRVAPSSGRGSEPVGQNQRKREAWTDESGLATFDPIPAAAHCRLSWVSTFWLPYGRVSTEAPQVAATEDPAARADEFTVSAAKVVASALESGNAGNPPGVSEFSTADGKVKIIADLSDPSVVVFYFTTTEEGEVEVVAKAGDGSAPKSLGRVRMVTRTSRQGTKSIEGSLELAKADLTGTPGFSFYPAVQP